MSAALNIEQILVQASQRETEFDWIAAAGLYRKALNLLPGQGFPKIWEIYESLAFCLFRAAMQAGDVDESRAKLSEAGAIYDKAKETCSGLKDQRKDPKALRCEAMAAYVGYWFTDDVNAKRKYLQKCWQLTKDALKGFAEKGDSSEFCVTYSKLSSAVNHMYDLEWNSESRREMIREAMELGEQAIKFLSPSGDPGQLARALVETAVYSYLFGYNWIPRAEEKESYLHKSGTYWQKANELSKNTALLELLGMYEENLGWNVDQMLVRYEEALTLAKRTRDRFSIGVALDWLAYANYWKAYRTDDPTERLVIAQRALRYAEDTKQEFSSIGFVSQRGGLLWTGSPRAEYYLDLAGWALTSAERLDLLEKAANEGTIAVKLAETTGYPDIIMYAHHVLSLVLGSMVQLEPNPEKRRVLLETALDHRKESVKLIEQLQPFSYWNRGAMLSFLADLKAELSTLEEKSEVRRNILEEAVASKQDCLQMCAKDSLYSNKSDEPPFLSVFGGLQYSYGALLIRLNELTDKKEHLKTAIATFENAAQSFRKLGLHTREAECYWKVARIYDALGEHIRAAENFNMASDNYTSAAEKIPQLREFYQDNALYMKTWGEINKGRHHHVRLEYGLAKEHFEKAATMHESLKQWSYLAPNYSAWAEVENGEDLSRKERSEEALKAFEEATKLFARARKSLEIKLEEIVDADEKTMATSLVEASETRREYCLGRMTLEEAKILDKKGDHYSSSQKYDSAAQIFEGIFQSLKTEQEQREFKLIITLSRAWQKTTLAEAESSSALYLEASQLFEQVKEFSPNEKTTMLVLGHSRFCRALEAGTRFADSRDVTLHQVAEQHLESAANYYVRAGFQNASEYSKATEHLFDAYMYIDDAKKERDPEKKARLYTMAERVLQTSAGSFMKAEHPEKKEQVQRLLEKVKEERELALSLSEVLHAPSIVSTTAAFAPPTPNRENAVGLDKFEHADVHANIVVNRNDLRIGENLDLEIELTNAGKGTALLDKIEGVIPEGFEVTEKPQIYRVEGCNVNMKGRRLEQLKGEEVKFNLKPRHKGSYTLRPVILYIDENGNSKSHQSEPLTITVGELGIRGWLKGGR